MEDDLFFGAEKFTNGSPLPVSQIRLVQAICDECPVHRECLYHALTLPEEYGIWAGTSGNLREKMLRRVQAGADLDQIIDDYLEG